MQRDGVGILLPDNPAPYLTDWLFEIGPTSINGMGEGPIGWQDLTAWESLTGIELDAWEAKTLRRLSLAYLGQKIESREPDCPAPYIGLDDSNRERVSRKVGAIFGGRVAGGGRKR